MKTRLLSLLTLIFCTPTFSQLNHDNIRLEVLNNDIHEKVFVYGEWNEKDGEETHLNYLGTIISNEDEEYKIMTSCWFWGLTKKATNTILVFDNNNELLGNYYLDTVCLLPNKIADNKLLFTPSECNDCNNDIAEVNFNEGIPNAFYLGCKKGSGNIFSFYSSY